MEDEPTNPFVEKNAPKIGPHPPVTQQPEHHAIETYERSRHKQRTFLQALIVVVLIAVCVIGLLLFTSLL